MFWSVPVPTVPAMTAEPTAPRWRWRHVGERGMRIYEARPPAGDLRDSGARVTTHRSETVGRCQVCGRSRKLWRLTVGLPLHLLEFVLIGGGYCSRRHAAAATPTSWAQLVERLTADAEALRAAAQTESRFLMESRLRARQRDVAVFLAACDPAARAVAMRLWADNGGLCADVMTVTAGVLADGDEKDRA